MDNINKLLGGMNTDVHPSSQPENTTREVFNFVPMTETGNLYSMTNESGTRAMDVTLPDGFVVMGHSVLNNDIIVTLAHPNGYSQVGYITEDGNPDPTYGLYHPVAPYNEDTDSVPNDNIELGFSLAHPVDCVSRKIISGHRILYYTDNNNKPGQIDLEAPPIVGDAADQSALVPSFSVPHIGLLSINEPTAGAIKPGVYQFVTRYVTAGGGVTIFGIPTNPIPMVPTLKSGGANDYEGDYNDGDDINKSISLSISNIDTQFNEIELVAISYEGNSSVFRATVVATLPITSDTATYVYVGGENEQSFDISRAEIEQNAISYNRAKCIEQKDNTLFLSNLTVDNINDDELQGIANNVTVGYNVLEVPFSGRGSNEGSSSLFTLSSFPYIGTDELVVPFTQPPDAANTADFELYSFGTPTTGTITVGDYTAMVVGDTITIASYLTQDPVIITAVAPGAVNDNEFLIGATNDETATNIDAALTNSPDVTLFSVQSTVANVVNLSWVTVDLSAIPAITVSGLGVTPSGFSGGSVSTTVTAPTTATLSGNNIQLTFSVPVLPTDELLILNPLTSGDLIFTPTTSTIPIVATTPDGDGTVTEGFSDYLLEAYTTEFKGYRRGEVYSLGFSLLYKSGATSPVYHIPGKTGAYALGNNPGTWSTYNIGLNTGDLGTYISETQYPNEQNYPGNNLGDDNGQAGPAGLERNTRHHYMPELENEPHYRTVDGSSLIRIISLEYDFNVPIPQSILSEVAEIIFVRENRNVSNNKSIYAQGLVNKMYLGATTYNSDPFNGRVSGTATAVDIPGLPTSIRSDYQATPGLFFDNVTSINYVGDTNGDSAGLPTNGFAYPGQIDDGAGGGATYANGQKMNTIHFADQGMFYSPETTLDNLRLDTSKVSTAFLHPQLKMTGPVTTQNSKPDRWHRAGGTHKTIYLSRWLYRDLSVDYTNYVETPIAGTVDAVQFKELRQLKAGETYAPIDGERTRTDNEFGVQGAEFLLQTGQTLPDPGATPITGTRDLRLDLGPGDDADLSSFTTVTDNDRYLYNVRQVNTTQYSAVSTGKYLPIARRAVGETFATNYVGIFGGDTFITKFSYINANVVRYWPYNQFRAKPNNTKNSPIYNDNSAYSWDERDYSYPGSFINGSDYLTPPGWDLRSNNSYFVESDINTYYRHRDYTIEDGTKELASNSYYPRTDNEATLINDFTPWLGNPGAYNTQYSYDNFIKNYYPKSSTNNLITSFENRTVYSSIASNDDVLDSYREFAQNDYYDLPSNTGPIWDTFVSMGTLYLHTTKSLWRTFAERAATLSGGNIDDVVLGTGALFARPSQEMVTTEGGYAGTISQFGGAHAQIGYLFPDVLQGKIFGLVVTSSKSGSSMQLQEMSKDTLSTFCHKTMGQGLIETNGVFDHSNVTTENSHLIDNPFMGIGYSGGYDYKLKRVWITKLGAFTLSYSAVTNNWISYHDYQPNVYITYNNRAFFVKDGFWEINKGQKGDFFGTVYPATAEIIAVAGADGAFNNLVIASESTNDDDLLIRDDNFNTLQVWTDRHNTGDYTLVPGNAFAPTVGVGETLIKFRGNEYRVAIPRDSVINNAIDIFEPTNLEQMSQTRERVKGDYAHIKLTYTNESTLQYVLKSIKTIITQNIR